MTALSLHLSLQLFWSALHWLHGPIHLSHQLQHDSKGNVNQLQYYIHQGSKSRCSYLFLIHYSFLHGAHQDWHPYTVNTSNQCEGTTHLQVFHDSGAPLSPESTKNQAPFFSLACFVNGFLADLFHQWLVIVFS